MDQYTTQSYFKSLCKSFYIAYEQVKRLEKEMEELEKSHLEDELEVVNNLLTLLNADAPKEIKDKYVTSFYSIEELKQKKERLELVQKEYQKKLEGKNIIRNGWWQHVEQIGKDLYIICKEIKLDKFSLIITAKEEIVALMYLFNQRNLQIESDRIINVEEQYLEFFPTGEKMYEDFYKAYCSKDNEEMEKVYRKYF